jgi:hypothetical protein
MVLDRYSQETIGSIEIGTGEIRSYWLAPNSEVQRRAIFSIEKVNGESSSGSLP